MTLRRGSGRIQCLEGSLEYLLHRSGNKNDARSSTTLVLLHEGLGSVTMWRQFPQKLALATGCDVLAYSRFGYGQSDPCDLPWQLDYMHREGRQILPQVLAKIGSNRIVLIGHSDGASIATIYAGDHPDPRLGALVLIAPHFFTESISLESIQAALEAYEQGDLRARLERYHGTNTDNAFYGWNGAWLNPDFKKWDITEYLPRITVPVLLMQGKQDQYGTEAQINAATRNCAAQVETKMLDDCRHAPHLEREQTTIEAISQFIDRL
ncbi:MAG: alpha/beta hydrolase [Gammaproteobacteria bacterium]